MPHSITTLGRWSFNEYFPIATIFLYTHTIASKHLSVFAAMAKSTMQNQRTHHGIRVIFCISLSRSFLPHENLFTGVLR